MADQIMLDQVDVYPVGLLGAIQQDARHIRNWRLAPHGARPSKVWQVVRYIARHLRRRNWRAARMALNGYLAEPSQYPGRLRRCGSGWTRRRAMASLVRHARRSGVEVIGRA